MTGHVLLQLFLGDTNRTISETPMNMASSRSHCIFTLYLEGRKVLMLETIKSLRNISWVIWCERDLRIVFYKYRSNLLTSNRVKNHQHA